MQASFWIALLTPVILRKVMQLVSHIPKHNRTVRLLKQIKQIKTFKTNFSYFLNVVKNIQNTEIADILEKSSLLLGISPNLNFFSEALKWIAQFPKEKRAEVARKAKQILAPNLWFYAFEKVFVAIKHHPR